MYMYSFGLKNKTILQSKRAKSNIMLVMVLNLKPLLTGTIFLFSGILPSRRSIYSADYSSRSRLFKYICNNS